MKSQDTPRILLVDDDQELVASACTLLMREGLSVDVATGAEDALAKLNLENYDLVLLDLGLVGPEDGFTVLQQVKSTPRTRALPVIILTAWSDAERKVRALDLGASDYITKPFDGAELKARVRSSIRSRRLQAELIEANEQLQAARDRAEVEARAKSGLLAFKSHEIRSFMNGILPNAGFLGGTSLSDEQRDYVETIRQSSESILSIVNDILDFSRIESGKLELEDQPFELRKCIEDALDTLASKAGEKRLDLSYQIADGLPARIRGDVVRLRQILVNLLANALKFTREGEVALEVGGGEENLIQFSVIDTGIGIPVDKQSKLFSPFCQADASTSRQYGGSGLGLAISRRLAELMGGKLWLESEAGKGATFRFTMPLNEACDNPGTTFSRLRTPLSELRALVVDDNPRIRDLLQTMVKRWGGQAEPACSLDEATRLLNAGPGYDVVFLDATLEGSHPTTMVTKLRLTRHTAGTHFVLLSYVGSQNPSNLFSAHLAKPLKPAHVRDTLARLTQTQKTGQATAPTVVIPSGRPADTHPLRILLCDDNAINQKVASRMLTQLGYKPDVATNGIEALKAFDTAHYDLVFMDVQMPEMDGLEATRQLRERQTHPDRYPHCQPPPVIVAMTASAMPGDRDRCLKSGMDDYLAKPVRPDDLRKLVESWAKKLGPAMTAPATRGGSEPAQDGNAAANDILDWERLMDLAANDRDMLKELVGLYLRETEIQMDQLGAAVAAQSAPEVKRLAHKCAGGSATIGVGRLVPLLRQLELCGEENKLDATPPLYERVQKEFQILRGHLQLNPIGLREPSHH